MPWENRHGRRYYYRKRRVGARVVSEYVGAGLAAHLLAELDDCDRQITAAERTAWRDDCDRWTVALGGVINLHDSVRSILRATLTANGYHRHKGQWRKRRESTDNP